MSATQLKKHSNSPTDILRSRILKNVNLTAGGNSNRELRELCIDLINASNIDHEDIAAGCCLCKQTITNLADEKTYPMGDTMNRIIKYFEFEINLNAVDIKAAFRNKPKEF